jgi:RNA polymerase sigma factor (sigma-70 family)
MDTWSNALNDQNRLHNLLLCIARGDRRARDELDPAVRENIKDYLLANFSRSLSVQDIEEVTSQVILLMYLHVGEYRGANGGDSAWDWAHTIAWRQALKWIRTVGREVTFYDEPDDDSDPLAYQIYRAISQETLSSQSVEDQVDERLIIEKLVSIVARLPERDKKILYLSYVEGWKNKNIASYLGVSSARITQLMEAIEQKCRMELIRAGYEGL